jgi:ribosome modulation factor
MTKTKPAKVSTDTQTIDLDTLWAVGWDACLAGVSREDCPYDPVEQPAAACEWLAGWDDANH